MQVEHALMDVGCHKDVSVPAISDPAIEVTASPADARRERAEWWATLPTVERSRPAAEVLAEIRDED